MKKLCSYNILSLIYLIIQIEPCRGKNGLCHFRLQYGLSDVAQYVHHHLSDTWRVTFRQRYDFLQFRQAISAEILALDPVVDVLPGCSGYALHILYRIEQPQVRYKAFIRIVRVVGFHALHVQVLETETAYRIGSGYRYGCGDLFGQPHFIINVCARDIAVQFFRQVTKLFILIDG